MSVLFRSSVVVNKIACSTMNNMIMTKLAYKVQLRLIATKVSSGRGTLPHSFLELELDVFSIHTSYPFVKNGPLQSSHQTLGHVQKFSEVIATFFKVKSSAYDAPRALFVQKHGFLFLRNYTRKFLACQLKKTCSRGSSVNLTSVCDLHKPTVEH